MKEFGEFERQAVMIHEQLAAGEIYYEARDQLAKLADKLKGHRRTPRETPTVNPVFIVEMHLMMTDGAPQASSVSDDFLADLLVAIQTADGHLRHQVVSWMNWALDHHRLTNDQLQWLAVQLSQSKYLYDHLLERNSPGVYARSLTLVLLRFVLYAARQQEHPIEIATLKRLSNRVVVAMLGEKDLRGLVEGAGWVQTFAAYAGLCNEICVDERLNRGDKLFLLAAYLVAYRRLRAPLTMGEPDEGAAFVAQAVKTHPLYARYFIEDLKAWRQGMDKQDPNKPATWHRVFNYRHLLQLLLLDGALPAQVVQAIMEQENRG